MTNPNKPLQLANTIADAVERTRIGRTLIYSEIAAGKLKVRKIGRKTVILESDLQAWLASLPVRAA